MLMIQIHHLEKCFYGKENACQTNAKVAKNSSKNFQFILFEINLWEYNHFQLFENLENNFC